MCVAVASAVCPKYLLSVLAHVTANLKEFLHVCSILFERNSEDRDVPDTSTMKQTSSICFLVVFGDSRAIALHFCRWERLKRMNRSASLTDAPK